MFLNLIKDCTGNNITRGKFFFLVVFLHKLNTIFIDMLCTLHLTASEIKKSVIIQYRVAKAVDGIEINLLILNNSAGIVMQVQHHHLLLQKVCCVFIKCPNPPEARITADE